MPLPRSLTQPLRQNNLVVGSGYRGYFAPFNQQQAVATANSALGPTIYDLQVTGKFIDGAAGSFITAQPGWFDLGWIKNFKFTPGSKTGNIMTGYRGAIRAKYRAETSEKMSCLFMEATRTAMSISTGTQVFNLLAASGAGNVGQLGPLSASGAQSFAMTSYSASGGVGGAAVLTGAAGAGAAFPVGTYIVCDIDYNGTSFGYVGDAGANVFPGAVTDVDFIRKTSDYVACVAAVNGNALTLTGPFVGGGNNSAGNAPTSPQAGSKIQGVVGYASREGGTYIKEWSAIFVLGTIDGAQILFYYPRIAPDAFGGLTEENLPNATAMQTNGLAGTFDALAFDDPLDGETVVRYSAYYPPPGQTIQI
jgi:hypothetical protein